MLLTDEGKDEAEHVCNGASRAVEMLGRDLTDEMRDNFYKSLDYITANLRKLSKEGIPE